MAAPPKNLTVECFLVVSSTGDVRVAKRNPVLKLNEVAFPVTVQIPLTWGRIQNAAVKLVMAEPPEALVSYSDALTAQVPD